MLPPTILTEAVAQVGAIMILAKPENREKLIFFMGIERVRYRRPVHPGDVVVIEAHRAAAAQPDGRAARRRARRRQGRRRRHDDVRARPAQRRGASRSRAVGSAARLATQRNGPSAAIPILTARDAHTAHFESRMEVAPAVQHRRRQQQRADPPFVDMREDAAMPARVALRRTRLRERGARIRDRRQHVEREHALREWRVLVSAGSAVDAGAHSFSACCTQNPAEEIVNSFRGGSPLRMGDREERDAVEIHLLDSRRLAVAPGRQ